MSNFNILSLQVSPQHVGSISWVEQQNSTHSPSQAPNIGLGTPQQFIFLSSLKALINVSGVDVAVMV